MCGHGDLFAFAKVVPRSATEARIHADDGHNEMAHHLLRMAHAFVICGAPWHRGARCSTGATLDRKQNGN